MCALQPCVAEQHVLDVCVPPASMQQLRGTHLLHCPCGSPTKAAARTPASQRRPDLNSCSVQAPSHRLIPNLHDWDVSLAHELVGHLRMASVRQAQLEAACPVQAAASRHQPMSTRQLMQVSCQGGTGCLTSLRQPPAARGWNLGSLDRISREWSGLRRSLGCPTGSSLAPMGVQLNGGLGLPSGYSPRLLSKCCSSGCWVRPW